MSLCFRAGNEELGKGRDRAACQLVRHMDDEPEGGDVL